MFRNYVFALMMICVPALGYSLDLSNWYVRGLVGYNHLSLEEIPEARIDTKAGYVVGGALGYQFTNTFRLEGELSYRNNDLDKLIVKGDDYNFDLPLVGDISSLAYMVNALFALPVNWTFIPYFGFGLGGRQEWGKGEGKVHTTSSERPITIINIQERSSQMAYQAIVGLNLLRCKNIGCGLEYHFLNAISDRHSNHNHTLALSCSWAF